MWERLKFESNLILKAIETGNREESKNNLLFLIETGFIEDKNGKIAASATDPETVPVLPASSPKIDVETMKLKRLVDKLGQLSDMKIQLSELDKQLPNLSKEERAKTIERRRRLMESIEIWEDNILNSKVVF